MLPIDEAVNSDARHATRSDTEDAVGGVLDYAVNCESLSVVHRAIQPSALDGALRIVTFEAIDLAVGR